MFPFLLFLLASIFGFLIPGINALFPLKRPLFEKIVLGFSIGVVFWVIQSYVFQTMGFDFLSIVYVVFNLFIFVYFYKRYRGLNTASLEKIDLTSISITILGSILALSAVWFVGVRTSDGLFLCCRGVPDAIYHLSLTNSLTKSFPPYEPGMSGVLVKNYHYLSNLLAADFSRILNINYIDTQFRYLSLLAALLLGLLAIVFGQIMQLNKIITRWLLVFLYASGDIIYLLLYSRTKTWNFDVTIMDDATKLLAGPPRAFSIVLLLAGICLLGLFFKKKSLYAGILSAFIMGVLVGFKVYTGIFALSGLAFVGLYLLIKRQYRQLSVPILALLVSLAYYLPNNRDAGFLFFNGLWRFENFTQHKDLHTSKIDYLRISQLQKGNHIYALLISIVSIPIYFLTLYGTVCIGFFQSRKSLKTLPTGINVFLIGAIIVSLIAGSFFYQKTGGANTIQFLISVFIVGAIYASIAIYYWTRKTSPLVKYLIFLIVFILTVARPTYEIANNFINIKSQKGYLVTNAQIESFNYLKNNTPKDSLIVVEPWMAEDEPFMYITFLSDRDLFLSGAGVLRDHGQNTKNREETVFEIFNSSDFQRVTNLLKKNGIDYVYVSKGVKLPTAKSKNLKTVFTNESSNIYKVL